MWEIIKYVIIVLIGMIIMKKIFNVIANFFKVGVEVKNLKHTVEKGDKANEALISKVESNAKEMNHSTNKLLDKVDRSAIKMNDDAKDLLNEVQDKLSLKIKNEIMDIDKTLQQQINNVVLENVQLRAECQALKKTIEVNNNGLNDDRIDKILSVVTKNSDDKELRSYIVDEEELTM